jgi:hypothetical protein
MRISRSNVVSFTLLALTAFSCANGATTPYSQLSSISSSQVASGTSDPTVEGAYNCPLDPNVQAINDPNINGTDEYKVCKDTSAPSQILIHGETEISNQVCVIPAYSSPTGVVAYTQETIQCPMVTAGGIYVNYAGLSFNAVYIVEAQNSAQLVTCLQTGYNCPSTYSYGVFQ